MRRNKVMPVFAIMLMTLLMVSSVSAYITDQHYRINIEAFEQAQGSPILQEIRGYEAYFQACDELTDITVASYFDIDAKETDKWYHKLLKAVSFKMGKPYKATHDPVACINSLPEAKNIKEKACGYGICAHQIQDSTPHNKIVPEVIKQTGLSNGLVHSIEEIYLKDRFTDQSDFEGSRDVLDLGYEMTPYLEKVFGADPSLQKVDIPALVDLFITQVKPDADYSLGFRSFFALPAYVYWFVFIMFFIAIALMGLTVRKIMDKDYKIVTFFTFGLSSTLFLFFGAIIWGLVNKNIWEIWMAISQFLFSPAMYPIGGLFILLGGIITVKYFMAKDKVANLGSIIVAVFLLVVGIWFLTLPNALDLGQSQMMQYHEESVQNTVNLLKNGVISVQGVADPTGFQALKDADEQGAGVRTAVMGALVLFLISIMYFTFRPRKKKGKSVLI